MKKVKGSSVLLFSVVLLFNFTSCKKYEDGPMVSLKSKKARLVGEWEVVEMPDGILEDDMSELEIIFEFEKDGDCALNSKYIYEDGQTYSYSYKGEWEWEKGKEELDVEFEDEGVEFKIKRLTNKEFWFESDFGFADEEFWKCEKK